MLISLEVSIKVEVDAAIVVSSASFLAISFSQIDSTLAVSMVLRGLVYLNMCLIVKCNWLGSPVASVSGVYEQRILMLALVGLIGDKVGR